MNLLIFPYVIYIQASTLNTFTSLVIYFLRLSKRLSGFSLLKVFHVFSDVFEFANLSLRDLYLNLHSQHGDHFQHLFSQAAKEMKWILAPESLTCIFSVCEFPNLSFCHLYLSLHSQHVHLPQHLFSQATEEIKSDSH